MAHAYTPGLTVSGFATIRRKRVLPVKGEVVVSLGQGVGPASVISRTHLPGRVHAKNVASELGIPPSDLPAAMLKREGDPVFEGETVAERASFFGIFSSRTGAPVSGTVETISSVTGQVLFREPPVPLEVCAYVRGIVADIIPMEGAIVEARGAWIQGIFGIGGETCGPIALGVESPDAELAPASIRPEHAGTILVGGRIVTHETVREAIRVGVLAIVVGGVHDDDLRAILGFDLGVAITGHETIGLTLVVTEGFGPLPIARRTFDLLARHVGREASINGATQIRAGVIRPEVIIPAEDGGPSVSAAAPSSAACRETSASEEGRRNGAGPAITVPVEGGSDGSGRSARRTAGLMEVGSPVRVTREPWFGAIGVVESLPVEEASVETEAKVRVAGVRLREGRLVTLPRANVELFDE